jgi:Tfp pilus assembly protein PilO
MSTRDRLVLLGLGAVAVLAAAWMLLVSPARKQASTASAELASARTQLAQAQGEAAQAQSAQQRYRKAYASLSSLGMAVPTSQEIPSLMYSLDHAANHHKVAFSSITNGGSSSSTTPSSTAAGSPSTVAASAPFSQVPFTFVFTGGYEDLVKLLTNLEAFTLQTSDGVLRVSGRLLTVQSIQLAGGAGSSASGASANADEMSWTISASAYVLAPPSATGPTPPASAPGAATPASAGGSPSVGTPAVVKVGG